MVDDPAPCFNGRPPGVWARTTRVYRYGDSADHNLAAGTAICTETFRVKYAGTFSKG